MEKVCSFSVKNCGLYEPRLFYKLRLLNDHVFKIKKYHIYLFINRRNKTEGHLMKNVGWVSFRYEHIRIRLYSLVPQLIRYFAPVIPACFHPHKHTDKQHFLCKSKLKWITKCDIFRLTDNYGKPIKMETTVYIIKHSKY